MPEVRQIGDKDGDHCVRCRPQDRKDSDPQVVPYPTPFPLLFAQRHVLPYDIIWFRRKHYRGTLWVLVPSFEGDTVGFSNVIIAGKSVRKWIPVVNGQADLLDFRLQFMYSACEVLNRIDLLIFRVR